MTTAISRSLIFKPLNRKAAAKMKFQFPILKSQTNTNIQTPILQPRRKLKIEIWRLFGNWVLGIGIFALSVFPQAISQEKRSAAGDRQSVDLTIYNQNLSLIREERDRKSV